MKAERDKLVHRDTRIAIWNALRAEDIDGATCYRIIDSLAPEIETLIARARQEAREEAIQVVHQIAEIGKRSPFWDAGQAQMFVDAEERIRALGSKSNG